MLSGPVRETDGDEGDIQSTMITTYMEGLLSDQPAGAGCQLLSLQVRRNGSLLATKFELARRTGAIQKPVIQSRGWTTYQDPNSRH